MECESSNKSLSFAQESILEAKKAYKKNEVPVGAIVVYNDEIVGRGHNMCEESENALFHAEVVAVSQAAENLKTKNLSGATLYTTLEPCMMCLGYINLMKIDTVIYLAIDKKYGVCGGWQDLSLLKPFGNTLRVIQIEDKKLIQESSELLTKFFSSIR